MALGLTYSGLKALNPCSDSFLRVTKLLGGTKKWNGHKITAMQARAAGATFNDIIWAASAVARSDKDVDRRLRLWMADCAAHVLPIYETFSESDDRPRKAIIAARQLARGDIDDAARAAAWAAARAVAAAGAAAGAAAWVAAGAAAWDAAASGAAAGDAARATARAAAWAAARAVAAAGAAAGDAAWVAAGAAAWVVAEAAEETWQFDRLIMWLSDDEPADHPLSPPSSLKQAA